MEFNESLKRLLIEKNMKQADLCRLAHIQTSLMSEYINGKKSPTIGNAIQIADALDISLDVLAGREERVRYSESVPNVYVSQLNDCMNGLSENAPIIRYDITITYPMTGDIISPTVIWIMQKVIVISRLIAIRLITRPVRLVFCIIICLSTS